MANAESIIAQLDADAEEMVGNPSDEEATNQVVEEIVESVEQEVITQEESISSQDKDLEFQEADIEAQEEQAQPQKQKRTNWKKRFINYKDATDSTLHNLRMEIDKLGREVLSARSENEQLRSLVSQTTQKKDTLDGVFTENDVDTFGEEGIEILKKGIKSIEEKAVVPLRQELEEERKARRQDLERKLEADRVTTYKQFETRLDSIAEGWRDLNKDQGFLNWLTHVDDGDVTSRQVRIAEAEQSLNSNVVANYFNRYKASLRPDNSRLDQHLTPSTRGNPVQTQKTSSGNPAVTLEFIEKFNDDISKGRFRNDPDEQTRIENLIDSHYEKLLSQAPSRPAFRR